MKVSLEREITLFLVAYVNGDSVTIYQSQNQVAAYFVTCCQLPVGKKCVLMQSRDTQRD